MLKIVDAPVQKKSYMRIPMHVRIDQVTAAVYHNRTMYRPKGGDFSSRATRALMLQTQLGGETLFNSESSLVELWVPFEDKRT